LVAAQQESSESNYRQNKGWHVSRLFAFIRLEVNLLTGGWSNGEGQEQFGRTVSVGNRRIFIAMTADSKHRHDSSRGNILQANQAGLGREEPAPWFYFCASVCVGDWDIASS